MSIPEPGAVTVLDSAIAAYKPLVQAVAARLHQDGSYVWKDDLVQEGLIAVWLVLSTGQKPNEEDVERRMLKWIRKEVRRGGNNTRITLDDGTSIPVEVGVHDEAEELQQA